MGSIVHTRGGASGFSMRGVDAYSYVLGAAAVLLVASTLSTLARAPAVWTSLSAGHALLAVALLAAGYAALHLLVPFDWRGHRVVVAADAVFAFVALLAFPAAVVVVLAVPPILLHHAIHRRGAWRATHDVALLVISAAAGASVAVALGASLGALPAASAGVVAYAFTTQALVRSVVFVRDATGLREAFGERFLVPAIFHAAFGVAGGLAVVALWSFHPAAIAALVPIAWLVREHGALVARRDREAGVHARLARTARELVGERDLDVVAARVLSACGDLFDAGQVTIVASEDGRERRWSREFGAGSDTRRAPIAAPLHGPSGQTIGAVLVFPRRQASAYADADEHVLGIVAGEAASTISTARALRALDSARVRLETLLGTASDAVVLIGTDGVLRFTNPAAATLGLREGASARDLFEDLAFLRLAVRGEERRLHATRVRAPTRLVPIEVSAARLKDDPTLVMAIVRDATARKAAEEALLSQRVARPLVRRIIRGLMEETRASSLVLMRLGEQLAAGVQGTTVAEHVKAYGEMGLGTLRVEKDGDRMTIVGEDLLESAERSRTATCFLSLGFLRGAAARAHGRPASGAEVACRSRGDPECRFVVHVARGP